MSQTLKLSVTSNTFKTRVNIYISKIQERNLIILSFTDFDFKINISKTCTYQLHMVDRVLILILKSKSVNDRSIHVENFLPPSVCLEQDDFYPEMFLF